MKKKLSECEIHGTTLFRCKRKCWRSGGKKDKSFADQYSEKCFKCIKEVLLPLNHSGVGQPGVPVEATDLVVADGS